MSNFLCNLDLNIVAHREQLQNISRCHMLVCNMNIFSILINKYNVDIIQFLFDLLKKNQLIVRPESYIYAAYKLPLSDLTKMQFMLNNYKLLFWVKAPISWNIYDNSAMRKYILLNKKNYNIFKIVINAATAQLLIRHYWLTSRFRQTARRYYHKTGAMLLCELLPLDVIWIVIKYLIN